MDELTVTEVTRHFAAYIDRVAYRGERFRLVRGGRPVAEMTPVPAGRRLRELPELLAECPRLGQEEADAMASDFGIAVSVLVESGPQDPWKS